MATVTKPKPYPNTKKEAVPHGLFFFFFFMDKIRRNTMDRSKSRILGTKYASYNASVMGPLAYGSVYPSPEATTDAEFVGVADKAKKAPSKWAGSKFRTSFEMKTYLRAARLVAEHYMSAVGRFYNASVVLSNFSYIQAHKKGEVSVALQMALAIVWRLMYEGLGLAGWTPPARLFLNILVAASYGLSADKRNPRFTYVKDGDWEDGGYPDWWAKGCKPSAVRKDTPDKLKIPAIPYLVELAGVEHLGKTGQVAFRYILWAVKVSLDWSAIEKGRASVAYLSEAQWQDAVLYGALRRAGQGFDGAGLEELASAVEAGDGLGGEEDEEILPQSCLRALLNDYGELEDWVAPKLGNHPQLIETLEMAAKAHTAIEDFIFAQSYGGDID